MTYRVIMAIEPLTGVIFNRAYADLMGLPFETGWDHYGVFEINGDAEPVRVATCPDFEAASKLLN